MRAEYDFAKMGTPIRGKHARSLRRGSNLVLLDPEVAKAFPTDEDVNAALRGVMAIAERIKPRRRHSTSAPATKS